MKRTVKKLIRPIRSYVRREGRMTSGQWRAIEYLWDKYGLEIDDCPIDTATIFQRSAATIVEIGFGMGQTLLKMAASDPQTNFIGIEVYRPGVGALLAGLEKHQIGNVRVFRADAMQVLQDCFVDASLDAIYIFFPDPWPKKRHHKRRLVQPEFIEIVKEKLKLGGRLHLATDWQDYASQMLEVVSSVKGLSNTAGEGKYAFRPDYRPVTKFEQRGVNLGHRVWDLIFTKDCE